MTFGNTIIKWYEEHKRRLPWRGIADAYKIWLSEIILQQTRVEQGLPYYERFVKRFPDVRKLAAAREDEVLKLWQGLGYYSRARNLHHAAKEIVKKHKGRFPHKYHDIRALRGIGDYTAAAIASFAFGLPYAAVDGNVQRLLSRYLGIRIPPQSPEGKKLFAETAQKLLANHPPHIYNQAIMEFGALQCKPANPDCESCPLNTSCIAFAKGMVKELPVKPAKQKSRNRYFHYLIIIHGNSILMKKRTGNDIWKNLYDFPLLETGKRTSASALQSGREWRQVWRGQKVRTTSISEAYIHILSHQKICARFYEIEVTHIPSWTGAKAIPLKAIHRLALPKLIERYLKEKEKQGG